MKYPTASISEETSCRTPSPSRMKKGLPSGPAHRRLSVHRSRVVLHLGYEPAEETGLQAPRGTLPCCLLWDSTPSSFFLSGCLTGAYCLPCGWIASSTANSCSSLFGLPAFLDASTNAFSEQSSLVYKGNVAIVNDSCRAVEIHQHTAATEVPSTPLPSADASPDRRGRLSGSLGNLLETV